LEGRAAGSSLTGFCPLCAVITQLPGTSPLDDADEITSGFLAGPCSMTKLSGADLVNVRGNLEFGDKPACAVFTSLSPPGVSVELVKLHNQFSPLSTTSVCASDSGVSSF